MYPISGTKCKTCLEVVWAYRNNYSEKIKAQENVFYPMKNKEVLTILDTRMIARWSRTHLFQATQFLIFHHWLTFKPRSRVEIRLYSTHASEARRTIVFAIKRFRYINGRNPSIMGSWLRSFPTYFSVTGTKNVVRYSKDFIMWWSVVSNFLSVSCHIK